MQNHVKKHAWLCSTIGRKQLIGVTGLGLSFFVLTHMLGNMLILVGPEPYNKYSYALTSNELIYAAEAGLLAMFVGHLLFAIGLTIKNWGARDTRYAMLPNGAKATSWTQRSLWAQGLLILVFVVLHLITFKFGQHYSVNYNGVEMRDLHKLVIEVFHEPMYVAWYVVALIVLGLHLSHGVGSSLQTLGINHPRYNKCFKCLSRGYAVVVIAGFLSQPLYVYFMH